MNYGDGIQENHQEWILFIHQEWIPFLYVIRVLKKEDIKPSLDVKEGSRKGMAFHSCIKEVMVWHLAQSQEGPLFS